MSGRVQQEFHRRLTCAVLFTVILMTTASQAGAHGDPRDSRWLVTHADLIFEGVVTGVQYRVSDVVQKSEDVPIPHTYVSFRIDRLLKGRSEANNVITVRLEGGLDVATEEVLEVEGVPRFDLNESVILFVRGNTVRACPVTGWDEGRFRVVGGYVYSEFGQEVWLTGANKFVLGPSHALPEVVNHSIAGRLLVLEMSPVPQAPWKPPAGWRRADAGGFAAAVSQLVKELHSATELANVPPVKSAYIGEKLIVKEAKAGPPSPIRNSQ